MMHIIGKSIDAMYMENKRRCDIWKTNEWIGIQNMDYIEYE